MKVLKEILPGNTVKEGGLMSKVEEEFCRIRMHIAIRLHNEGQERDTVCSRKNLILVNFKVVSS